MYYIWRLTTLNFFILAFKEWLFGWGFVFSSGILDAVAIFMIKHSLNTLGPIPLSDFHSLLNYILNLQKSICNFWWNWLHYLPYTMVSCYVQIRDNYCLPGFSWSSYYYCAHASNIFLG